MTDSTTDPIEIVPQVDNVPHPLGLAGFGHDPRNLDFRALVRPGPRTTLPFHPWYTSLVLDQDSKARHAYRVVNSWGKGWGQNGRAWIRDVDLAALLDADGEAVTVAVA